MKELFFLNPATLYLSGTHTWALRRTYAHLCSGTVTQDWLGGDWRLCKLLAYQKLFLILLSAKHFPAANQSQLSEVMEMLSE